MKDELGIDVPSDKEGVLQDVHWGVGGACVRLCASTSVAVGGDPWIDHRGSPTHYHDHLTRPYPHSFHHNTTITAVGYFPSYSLGLAFNLCFCVFV